MERLKRNGNSVGKTDLDEIEIAAYGVVNKMVHVADGYNGVSPFWFGWALRAAFRKGAEWQKEQSNAKVSRDER